QAATRLRRAAVARRPLMTSGALEAAAHSGAAEAEGAPRRRVLRCLGGGETRGRKWARHTFAQARGGAELRATSAPRRALPTAPTPGCRPRRDFMIPRSKRIPAGSASLPTSRAAPRTDRKSVV